MSRMLPVREWTCPEHDWPQQCETCERWDCDVCAASKWVVVGEREAGPWEELLLRYPLKGPIPSVLLDALLESDPGDEQSEATP